MNDALSQKEDYYKVLGIGRGATDDEIKKAYRKKAKQYHPDLNKGDKAAETKFKEINEAYETLSDGQRRAQYDQFGHAAQNFGGGYSSSHFNNGEGFDINDIFGGFESFFGGFGGSGRRRQSPHKGHDVEVKLTISFEDSVFGCRKNVSFERVASCDVCDGSGAAHGSSKKTCRNCRGTGQVVNSQRTPFGMIQTSHVCEACDGEGKINENPCTTCRGSGNVRKRENFEIDIPAGIDDNQILNVRGKGCAGANGGPNGDLHVLISVLPHQIFERKGNDIWCELPLTFTQASLGDEVVVPTLDGKVSYHIHEGTQHGDVFKLKNKGVPSVHGHGKGDQFVKACIEIPRNLTSEQKKLLVKFDEISSEKNYRGKQSFFEKIKNIFL